MKNLVIAILVFCAFVSAAFSHHAQKCYHCISGKNEEYKEQCEKDQKVIDCSDKVGNYTCIEAHITTLSGKQQVEKGCILKTRCKLLKNICEKGSLQEKKKKNVKECVVACCVSYGDKPCNGGFTVSINMFMIMFAVLCSLKLF